jgi:hypothetical protein
MTSFRRCRQRTQLITGVLLRLWFRAKLSRPTIHFFDRLPLIRLADSVRFFNNETYFVAYSKPLKTPLYVVVAGTVEPAHLQKTSVVTAPDQGCVG